MKIKNIEIENVLSFDKLKVDFNNDLNILVGPNGGGKSNLLNIVICILKQHFFHNYEVNKNNNIEDYYSEKYYISRKNMSFPKNEWQFLAKHKKLKDIDSKIIADVEFDKSDIENLLLMYSYKDDIIWFLNNKVMSISMGNAAGPISIPDAKSLIISTLNTNIKDVVKKMKKKTYTIELINKNDNWIANNEKIDPVMEYMNIFSIVLTILELSGIRHEINQKFMFFEAYRNNSQSSTVASLANNNGPSYQNYQSLANAKALTNTIGVNTSYIAQATIKYGDKRRKYAEDDIQKYKKDPEVIELNKYFDKLGYKLELSCLNYANNTYQFNIKKNNASIEIDLISTGERELINFIFGLFSEDIKNGIVIIDEPELHLHPIWQKKIISILKSISEKRGIQLFFSTHSATFINYNVVNDIFRIYMNKDGFSRYTKLYRDTSSNNEVRKLLKIINATNNEKIFFSKNCVLVEGITDDIIFKKIFSELLSDKEEEIEVVNIGGKGNYKDFKDFLSSLGVPHVYIGDRDNLNEEPKTKDYYKPDDKKISDEIKTAKSKDVGLLINALDSLKSNQDDETVNNVVSVYKKIEKRFMSEDDALTKETKREINKYIDELEAEGKYYLKRGDIEKYIDYSGTDKTVSFKTAIKKTTDEFDSWKKTVKYKELKGICKRILVKFGV